MTNLNRAEIVRRLSRSKDRIRKEFKEQSLGEVVTLSVGTNTFRAFRKLPTSPSKLFREWAVGQLEARETVRVLATMRSQAAYDVWVEKLSARLRTHWRKQTDNSLNYGASRKLIDLLLKGYARWNWSGLNEAQRENLISYLHVALDRYVLREIRLCEPSLGKEVPATASMAFVNTKSRYDRIQREIRKITDEAQVPAIYFDVLVWNRDQYGSLD